MFAYIQGTILIKKNDSVVVVLESGLGYKVFITGFVSAGLMIGDTVRLFLYHQVKEDGQALFGFTDLETLDFFEMLLGVSGIGPKSALNILSSTDIDSLGQAISLGEPELLTKVSGIGKKMAEKIVVELKSKFKNLSFGSSLSAASADEIDALVGLGYSLASARQALDQVGKEVSGSGDRVREALKFLAK